MLREQKEVLSGSRELWFVVFVVVTCFVGVLVVGFRGMFVCLVGWFAFFLFFHSTLTLM